MYNSDFLLKELYMLCFLIMIERKLNFFKAILKVQNHIIFTKLIKIIKSFFSFF